MTKTPSYDIRAEGDETVFAPAGSWIVTMIGKLNSDLKRETAGEGRFSVDLSGVEKLDTAGAYLIDRTAAKLGGDDYEISDTDDKKSALMDQARELRHAADEEAPPPRKRDFGVIDLLERTGRTSVHFVQEVYDSIAFLGETIWSVAGVLIRPARMRWTALVSIMEESGLDAVPIVSFLSFFVGMVIAFIGATLLREFGATIFTVELVGFAILREFGAVLTGIILAGRTNSAFTAQIGSMKMRQEVDAMTTLGLSPMEVLVAPRVLAMIIMAPVLTFVAPLAGLAGGAAVCWLALDVAPTVFINRLQEMIPISQFWVGMSKAPVFGLVVALIGCRQGLMTGSSVQSLGQSTTRSVVQALFAIIVIDALFAMFYMEMGV